MNLRPIQRVRVAARTALGLVWVYEGLVPKLLFVRPEQIDLVQHSGFGFGAPAVTLRILGAAQVLVGLWLLSGCRERAAVFLATGWMCTLIALVAWGNPAMLTDPYGALIKDLCLIACAFAVWTLRPVAPA